MSIITLSAKELRKAADLKDRIAKLESELDHLLGSSGKASDKPAKKKGGMSAAGRKAVAAGQKRRWAKINAGKAKPAAKVKKARKKMSAAAKAKISAAASARWAKVRAEKAQEK